LQPVPTRPKQFDDLLKPAGMSRPGSSQRLVGASTGGGRQIHQARLNPSLDDDDFLRSSIPPTFTKTTSAAHSRSPQPIDPFDFDQLAAVEPVAGGISRGTSGMRTPDADFHFGDGPGADESDDDDWLKELNKPVRAGARHSSSLVSVSSALKVLPTAFEALT
jgi:hypothetical protein